MALDNFGWLVGRPVDFIEAGEPSPHMQLQISAGGMLFRAAVNGRSGDGSLVQFRYVENIDEKIPSLKNKLKTLRKKFRSHNLYWKYRGVKIDNEIAGPERFCIDYLADNIWDPEQFEECPFDDNGGEGAEHPCGNLNDVFEELVRKTRINKNITFYISGQIWGPDASADLYFGNYPNMGIHDVHMNQGNPLNAEHPGWYEDNGRLQDGCILVLTKKYVTRADGKRESVYTWDGIFLKFQSQETEVDAEGKPQT